MGVASPLPVRLPLLAGPLLSPTDLLSCDGHLGLCGAQKSPAAGCYGDSTCVERGQAWVQIQL